MTSYIRPSLSRAIAPLAISTMLGCAGVPPEDPRINQLVAGMDECLAHQAQAGVQLESQMQQLARQQDQLEMLVQKQQAPATAPPPAAVKAVSCPPQEKGPDKLLIGQVEQVWLPNLEMALPARVDTGAETASLDARNIELFERNGKRWVRFELVHPESGEKIPLERKLKRTVVILQSNSTAEPERRPVIQLAVTIGPVDQTAEFTLSDRAHLDQPMLLGRNILQDVMVVDVSKNNIAPYVLSEKTDPGSKQ